jgi:hypothetical protein
MSEARNVVLDSTESGPTPVTDPGRRLIAAIAIDAYSHWRHLDNAVSDARGVLAVFEQLGFAHAAPPLFDDKATGAAMRRLVSDDLTHLLPTDSLVVFYAGHGHSRSHRLPSGQEVTTGYLAPVDAEPAADRVATLIELDSWLDAISLLPPRHILVVLDACHSGIALGSMIKWRDRGHPDRHRLDALSQLTSRRVITSALGAQTASDSGPRPGHSLFTGCLVDALTGGIDPSLGVVTGTELAVYVQRRVSTYPKSKQTPDFGAFGHDDRGEMLIPLSADARFHVAPPPPPEPRPRSARTRRRFVAVVAGLAAAAAVTTGVAIATCNPDPRRAALGDAAGPTPQQRVERLNAWAPLPGSSRRMQVHEVTREEYVEFLRATGKDQGGVPWADGVPDTDEERRLPATRITLDDAKTFCAWLGGSLPASGEWLAAAAQAATLPDAFTSCGPDRPHGVQASAEPPTPAGFYDLVTNAAELLATRSTANKTQVAGFACSESGDEIRDGVASGRWITEVLQTPNGVDFTSDLYGFRCVRDAAITADPP